MSQASTQSNYLPLSARACAPPAVGLLGFLLAAGIMVLAVGLRAWNISGVFESSDQAAMAQMIRHNYGLKWIFAHNYGPVLPLLGRVWAQILVLLHRPIGEASARWPVMLFSCAQVAVTYPLLRRLGRPSGEALAGMFCCAVLPNLVTDAHYTWGDHTIWLFFGSVALWATLAYIDERRGWQLSLAAAALFLHCLSSLYAFALPVTLMGAWWLAWVRRRPAARTARRRLTDWPSGPVLAGFVLPCLAALGVIALCYIWTGRGQIGHLLDKRSIGTFGLHFAQIGRLGALWSSQLGVVFGTITALGGLAGAAAHLRLERRGLLALWAWNGLIPVLLFTDWDCTGYPAYYVFEAVYTAGLLGVLWLFGIYRAVPALRLTLVLAAVCSCGQLAAGSADAGLPNTDLHRYTGIVTGWGDVRRDTGIKAAGWYVRRHVPLAATVLSLHTNDGMEVNIAEYYCGRRVIAHYDILPQMLPPLLAEMQREIDVVIVAAGRETLAAGLADFAPVCRLYNAGRLVRCIYARRAWALPVLDLDVAAVNPQYDRRYTPRRVPVPLPAAAGFEAKLARFQKAIRVLQATRFAHQKAPAAGAQMGP